MAKNYSNPCIRCGKERIDSETWEETVINFIGTTIVTHTKTVCPDPECQKLVERELENQRKKKEEFERNKEERKAKFKELSQKKLKSLETAKSKK